MDIFNLITRNVEESVTESGIHELANDPEGKRIYFDYEPSGVLYLGYLLTPTKLIDLQEAGFKIVILLADVHAYPTGKDVTPRTSRESAA